MDPIVLDFLRDLNDNNNREWFQANKGRYQQAKDAFEQFVNEIIPIIRDIDPSIDLVTAKDCVFRIYRDVRFSANKSPYKTNMGAYIARGGKGSAMAGYYVHCEPGGSFLAGGLYMPQPDILKKARNEVYFQFDEFTKIISNKEFVRFFGELDDEAKMKIAPRDFPKEFKGIEYLKFRNYVVMHMVTDKAVISKDYPSHVKEVFNALYPLNVFLNRLFE